MSIGGFREFCVVMNLNRIQTISVWYNSEKEESASSDLNDNGVSLATQKMFFKACLLEYRFRIFKLAELSVIINYCTFILYVTFYMDRKHSIQTRNIYYTCGRQICAHYTFPEPNILELSGKAENITGRRNTAFRSKRSCIQNVRVCLYSTVIQENSNNL